MLFGDKSEDRRRDLLEKLEKIPVVDIHTHLSAGHSQARTLGDIVLYGHITGQLKSAGAASAIFDRNNPLDDRIYAAVSELPNLRATSNYWMIRKILHDLYDMEERDLTLENAPVIDARIRETAESLDWTEQVMRRANIVSTLVNTNARGEGDEPHAHRFKLMYEHPCFGTVHAPRNYDHPLQVSERLLGKPIESAADLEAAVEKHLGAIPWQEIHAYTAWIVHDFGFQAIERDSIERVIASFRSSAGIDNGSTDLYGYQQINSLIMKRVLDELQRRHIPFQLCIGSEAYQGCPVSRVWPEMMDNWLRWFFEYPKVHFNLLLASTAHSQEVTTYAKDIPNVSVAGYWWHALYPESIRRMFAERLENIPLNKIIGFFSDAYCIEWQYGKLALVREQMSIVLTEMIEHGFYTENEVLEYARIILEKTPKIVYGII